MTATACDLTASGKRADGQSQPVGDRPVCPTRSSAPHTANWRGPWLAAFLIRLLERRDDWPAQACLAGSNGRCGRSLGSSRSLFGGLSCPFCRCSSGFGCRSPCVGIGGGGNFTCLGGPFGHFWRRFCNLCSRSFGVGGQRSGLDNRGRRGRWFRISCLCRRWCRCSSSRLGVGSGSGGLCWR